MSTSENDVMTRLLLMLVRTIYRLLSFYVDAFELPVRRILQLAGAAEVADQIFAPDQSIDKRIAKLDSARANILESLDAIDELKRTAEINKAELDEALEKLKALELEKASAERELTEMRKIATADIGALQRLIGLAPRDRWIERAIGFVAGFVASLLASIVFWLFT